MPTPSEATRSANRPAWVGRRVEGAVQDQQQRDGPAAVAPAVIAASRQPTVPRDEPEVQQPRRREVVTNPPDVGAQAREPHEQRHAEPKPAGPRPARSREATRTIPPSNGPSHRLRTPYARPSNTVPPARDVLDAGQPNSPSTTHGRAGQRGHHAHRPGRGSSPRTAQRPAPPRRSRSAPSAGPACRPVAGATACHEQAERHRDGARGHGPGHAENPAATRGRRTNAIAAATRAAARPTRANAAWTGIRMRRWSR